MTDKQIIFGVDVSKCPYAEPAYGSPKCRINGYVHCDDFRNCEYKQLKRKKQRIVELNKTIKAKEQECEELKKQLKEMNEVIRTETTRCNLVNILKTELDQFKAENERLEAHSATLDAVIETGRVQYKALKQTLTEIKEIAGKIANYYDGDEYELMRKDAEQILQKISEVEDEK